MIAMVALIDVASKEGRTAVLNIVKRFFLDRCERRSTLASIVLPVEADNVSHLQHEDLGSLEVLHKLVEGITDRFAHLARQMRIDLCRGCVAMAQILLNDPQVDAGFQ